MKMKETRVCVPYLFVLCTEIQNKAMGTQPLASLFFAICYPYFFLHFDEMIFIIVRAIWGRILRFLLLLPLVQIQHPQIKTEAT